MAINFSNQVTGLAEVDRKLAELASKERRRIVRKAMNAGLTVGRKAIRDELTAAGVSPQLRNALARTIASGFKRARRSDEHAARVGMGLGKRKPAVRSGRNTGGVGIGKANVHWFLLGTRIRFARKPKRLAGRIKALPIVRNAGNRSAGQMVETIRRTALEEIEATVNRLR